MSVRFLFDTNAASAFIRRRGAMRARAAALPIALIGISSITAAEIHYGVAKQPKAISLAQAIREFLNAISTLPWTEDIAPHYGTLRAALEAKGVTISPLDLMIAAHALALDATLISADKGLERIGIVKIEDWSA